MKYKLDFALLLFDEFSGKPIAGTGSVFEVNGGSVGAIVKKDGFYLFSGIGLDEIELGIIRPHYLPQLEHVVISQLDPAHPVVKSRLQRKDSGVYPDCGWFYGKVPPKSKVLIFEEMEGAVGRVSGSRLEIQNYSPDLLLERRFSLDPDCGHTFLITKHLGAGSYMVDQELAPGNSMPVYSAHLSSAFADGRVSIPCKCPERIAKMLYYEASKSRKGGGKWVTVPVAERS